MSRRTVGGVEIPSLVEAVAKPSIMGIDLTPRQMELLQQVELGFLLHIWALGRRSGKTLLAVLIALYFATMRPDMARYVRRREKRYCVAVATNMRQARIFVEQATSIIEGSPFLQGFVEKITDDGIDPPGRSTASAAGSDSPARTTSCSWTRWAVTFTTAGCAVGSTRRSTGRSCRG
jgi:hypothetical protein